MSDETAALAAERIERMRCDQELISEQNKIDAGINDVLVALAQLLIDSAGVPAANVDAKLAEIVETWTKRDEKRSLVATHVLAELRRRRSKAAHVVEAVDTGRPN